MVANCNSPKVFAASFSDICQEGEATAKLDEGALSQILKYVSEPRGRACCRSWSAHLSESLNLQNRVHLAKVLHRKGALLYHHSAVRELGPEFEECVSYQFEFAQGHFYTLQWSRTFDGWTAENERQIGRWALRGDFLRCESLPGPPTEEGYVRYAAPGLVFDLPLQDVCKGQTTADKKPTPWEFAARGKREATPEESKEPDEEARPLDPELEAPIDAAALGTGVAQPTTTAGGTAELWGCARFAEIDGEVHQVSNDIVENWPESDWVRLMRCRLRFGIRGPV